MERRYIDAEDLRATEPSEDGESLKVRGHAAVFDTLSGNLGGFREIIAPGAFSSAIKRDDVRALYNHDPNQILGRVKSGTLRMWEDEIGLAVEIDLPNTERGRDLHEMIRRGDVDQMSFGFGVEVDDKGERRERWQKVNGEHVRTVEAAKLYDVSPVVYPAYTSTDVSVRSTLPAESAAALATLEGQESEEENNTHTGNDRLRKSLELKEKE